MHSNGIDEYAAAAQPGVLVGGSVGGLASVISFILGFVALATVVGAVVGFRSYYLRIHYGRECWLTASRPRRVFEEETALFEDP